VTRRVADRYLLGEQLGAGGTSRVYAALDERLGRQVAIKLLDASLVASADPAGRERFIREGPTSASFNHRNAVTVFDAGEDDGDLYIVMELVDGPSLAERLARTGPLAVDEATSITRSVLAALDAAHTGGIVHRDVKPANVLLASDGDVKLADFGIAKRFDDLEDSVTTAGTVIGTPRYLAPEQATGAPATFATDIYATGILLFEMLTGHPPSPSAPDVRTLRPEVSEQLAGTVARALAAKPADRFSSALAMATELADSSAMATQVMDATKPTDRQGDTELMTVLPPAAPTAAAPPPVTVGPAREASKARPLVIAAVLLLVGVVVAVLLAVGGDDTRLVVGPTSVGGATVPATAVATEATLVATAAPNSTAAPIPPTAPVDEIIPGFARTDDIEVFLLQLEDDPALVGERGQELAVKLRELLDQKSGKKQRDAVNGLRKEMEQWVEDEGLNADIAAALDLLLEPLAG